jgi:phage terminase large subunit
LAAQACKAEIAKPRAVPTFRSACLEAQTITDHEWMLAGPAETGKTFAALWRLDSLLRSTPRSRASIVRKIRADMNATVLQTWDRIIAIRGGVTRFGGENADFYVYPNGAHAFVGGLDRPGKVLSGERDWIYVNQAEELTESDWETLTTRATGRGAVTDTPMLFGDCNPGPPTHWIKHRPSLHVLCSEHTDNPTLYDEAGTITAQGVRTMSVLDALTGIRRSRFRDGLWVAAEGIVYANWQPAVHVIKPFPIPRGGRRIRSIDFGFVNPFSCSWWYIDEDERMFRYRQIYRVQTLVEDHAREIVRLTGNEPIEATVADHDAEDCATLQRHGVPTTPAFKAVSPGIQNVQSRLAVAADGRPRMAFFEGALVEADPALLAAHKPTCTEQEVECYVYASGNAAARPDKEEPAKKFDHGLDETRYAAAYVDHLHEGYDRALIAVQAVKSESRGTRGVF